MIIEIHNREEAEDGALKQALARVLYHQNVRKCDILVQKRVPEDAEPYRHPGWLEYQLSFHYEDGGHMIVGMVQRKIGADYEFHS